MNGIGELVREIWAAHGPELVAASVLLASAAAAALRYRAMHRRALYEHANAAELIENLSEGIYRSSLDGRMIYANRALVRLNGYDRLDELLAGVRDIAGEWYVDPGRREEFRDALQRDGRVENFVSEIHRHKTRERIWITESARLVRHKKSGKPLFYEGSVREFTETMLRLKLEEQFRKLTSHLPGGLFQITGATADEMRINYLSSGFSRLSEMPLERHFQERTLFRSIVHPDDLDAYVAAFRRSYQTHESLDIEFRIAVASGQEKWLRMTANPEQVNGEPVWYGYVSDISLRKRQAIEIEKLAYFDPLTRLPNRRLLLERIGSAIEACGRHGGKSALFFIDLDNFKTLNDTQGHDIGDQYLAEIADRLRSSVRETDTVARMGGDEFVVILETLGGDEAAAISRAIMAANQMLAAVRIDFERGEIRHRSSASIGIVVFDERERRVDEILKRADIAMYQAKAAGRDSAALFELSWMDGETERFTLVGELRRAVADRTLELMFQPLVDRSGQMAGAEALLRWRHPTLGMIPPDRFIPLAEQAGLMNQVCRFVLAAGIGQLARWRENPAMARLRLAVNVSVQSFSNGEFVPFVEKLLADHGVDGTRLTIEFTEHVMARDQRLVARRMRQLKELGVRFSLDDFGTGYSSLARLKSLPFDEVKIDGSFVADIESSDSDRALIRTILAMANTMGLEAVAEHVETRDQEAFLHAFGCDYFQGYLYARPLEAEALARFAVENRQAAAPVAATVVRLKA